MGELVIFKGGPHDGLVREMPALRGRWYMPPKLNVGYIGRRDELFMMLPQPSVYERSRKYDGGFDAEMVLTKDLIVKKGTPLSDFKTPWAWAIVYNCVDEGG